MTEVKQLMVGPRELESLTSAVSRRRSNQLSYGPVRKTNLSREPFAMARDDGHFSRSF